MSSTKRGTISMSSRWVNLLARLNDLWQRAGNAQQKKRSFQMKRSGWWENERDGLAAHVYRHCLRFIDSLRHLSLCCWQQRCRRINTSLTRFWLSYADIVPIRYLPSFPLHFLVVEAPILLFCTERQFLRGCAESEKFLVEDLWISQSLLTHIADVSP